MSDELGYQGTQDPQSKQGEFNAMAFFVQQMIARLNVAAVVKIIAVDDPGGTAAAGTVDVQPMVNQLDGSLTMMAHGTVFALPYMRLQGGANAFVVVPQVDDLGIALFADRDISSVKATRDQANPGSLRRFDMADGMYLGGMLNGAPVRYVRIDDNGVTIEGVDNVTVHGVTVTVNADTSATVTSPDIQLQGDTTITGKLTVTSDTDIGGDVQIGGNTHGDGDIVAGAISLEHHKHTGGTIAGLTGVPLP